LQKPDLSISKEMSKYHNIIIQNWEEGLIHQKVVLPSRGTSTGWRNGLTGTS